MGAADGAIVSELVCEAASGKSRRWLPFVFPLLAYLAVGIPCALAAMERLNSDGVCYLHRAVLLSQGDFANSVTGYWSPLIIWSTVPLLKLGVDPLHAIRWTLFIWGGAYVFTSSLFLRIVLPQKTVWRTLGGVAIALAAIRLSVPIITPDALLGATIMLYFAAVGRRELDSRRAFLVGLAGGLAYLAKAYALPFFVAHFLVSLIWRPNRVRTGLLGFAGFALLAGPWIAVLSMHYGKPTFSTATTRNRFMGDVAPPDVAAHPPDVSRLPPGPFISNMEVTDADAWPSWSPLDSSAHLVYQLKVVANHLGKLCADVWRLDFLALTVVAALLICWKWGTMDFTPRMLLLSAIIYSGGLMLVAYETRYVLPVLLPIGIVLCLLCVEKFSGNWQGLGVVVGSVFVIAASINCYQAMNLPGQKVSYRQMARELNDAGLSGTFATNTWNRDKAACLAFFLNRKFVAMPYDTDAATLQAKLDAAGVTLLTDWYDPNYTNDPAWPEPQMRALLQSGGWEKARSIKLDSKRRLDVYRRRW